MYLSGLSRALYKANGQLGKCGRTSTLEKYEEGRIGLGEAAQWGRLPSVWKVLGFIASTSNKKLKVEIGV